MLKVCAIRATATAARMGRVAVGGATGWNVGEEGGDVVVCHSAEG